MQRTPIAAGLTVAALLLTGCGGGSESSSSAPSGPPSDPIDQMLVTFNGGPSKGEIREAMDDALNATDTPITDENYSRAGSVLTNYRNEYGTDEMDILECMPSSVTDPRVPELSFPNVAAVCNTDLVAGAR